MKGYKLVLIFILLFSGNIFGQTNYLEVENFGSFSKHLSKEFGITCNIPEKFSNLDKYNVMWKVRKNKDKHAGSLYGSIFMSSNKECIIMYSALPMYTSKEVLEMRKKKALPIYPRSQIKAEIKTALGLYYHPYHPLNNDTTLDFNDYVTIVSGKKVREMFNADSMYIYDIPGADSIYFYDEYLEKIRKRRYPYCTTVFVSNDDRATMDIKLFFTKKGKKREDNYINLLSKHIWYDEDFKSR